MAEARWGEVGGPGFLTGIPWADTARLGPGCNCHWEHRACAPSDGPFARTGSRCACMCRVHGKLRASHPEQPIPGPKETT